MWYKGYEIFCHNHIITNEKEFIIYDCHAQFVAECKTEDEAKNFINKLV